MKEKENRQICEYTFYTFTTKRDQIVKDTSQITPPPSRALFTNIYKLGIGSKNREKIISGWQELFKTKLAQNSVPSQNINLQQST